MAVFDSCLPDDGKHLLAYEQLLVVNPELLQDAISGALKSQFLISFGSSRDAGAVSVQVLTPDGPEKRWAGTTEELEAALYAVYKATMGRDWSAVVGKPSPAPEGASTTVSAKTGVKRPGK